MPLQQIARKIHPERYQSLLGWQAEKYNWCWWWWLQTVFLLMLFFHGLLVQTTVFAATLCINGIPISKRTWGLQRILVCKEDFRFANQDTIFWLCKSLVWKALFSCLAIYFVRLEDHLKKCVLSLLLHRRAMWWISQFNVVILPSCCSLLDGCLAILWLLWISRSRSNKNLSTSWVWFPSQAFHV